MDNEQKFVTIYADGGAEPNPGPGGYAIPLIHGTHRRARAKSRGIIKSLRPDFQVPTETPHD